MSVIIKDGKGGGSSAQVDSDNRVKVRGFTDNGVVDGVAGGRTFAIATNIVNLTSDNHSHLLYVKNNGEEDLHLTHINLQFGVSDGTGDYQSILTINPTGGTLISAGTNGVAANLNSGSAESLTADIKIGNEGKTISGGGAITDLFSNVPDRYQVPLDIRLSKGSSASFSMKAPAGNSGCDVAVTLVLYKVSLVDKE